MPGSSQWVAFLVASFLGSVVGNGLGLVTQVLLVAVGLGAVVAASASAYTVLELVGAAYVVWLGIQSIRHRGDARRAQLAVLGLVLGAMAITSDPSGRCWPAGPGLVRPTPRTARHPGATGGVLMIGLGTTMAVAE